MTLRPESRLSTLRKKVTHSTPDPDPKGCQTSCHFGKDHALGLVRRYFLCAQEKIFVSLPEARL